VKQTCGQRAAAARCTQACCRTNLLFATHLHQASNRLQPQQRTAQILTPQHTACCQQCRAATTAAAIAQHAAAET
jgi:hypothetical protein